MRARFEALFMGVLTAVSNVGCIFFRILTSELEQCGPFLHFRPIFPIENVIPFEIFFLIMVKVIIIYN